MKHVTIQAGQLTKISTGREFKNNNVTRGSLDIIS